MLEDVGVDLCGADVCMAEQFLDGTDIVVGFQQVGGETVSQRIHTLPANSGRRGSFIDFIRSSSAVSSYSGGYG